MSQENQEHQENQENKEQVSQDQKVEEASQEEEVDTAKNEEIDELMEQQYAQQVEEKKSEEDAHFSLLLDIPLEVTVEIGSTQMEIEEVLKLNPNSIVELDRYINEPVDLKVNGKVIAQGELYTVKDNFGIRITHIITPEDRLKILER